MKCKRGLRVPELRLEIDNGSCRSGSRGGSQRLFGDAAGDGAVATTSVVRQEDEMLPEAVTQVANLKERK